MLIRIVRVYFLIAHVAQGSYVLIVVHINFYIYYKYSIYYSLLLFCKAIKYSIFVSYKTFFLFKKIFIYCISGNNLFIQRKK